MNKPVAPIPRIARTRHGGGLGGAFILLLMTATGLLAGETLDLSRITPVPAGRQIPVMDFFRPPLLRDAQLSPDGEHLAALVAPERDQQDLMVQNLKDGTFKVVGGVGDRDIYNFRWLTKNCVVFSLATDKLYAEGLLAANIDRLKESYPLLENVLDYVVSVPDADPSRPLVWIQNDPFNDRRDDGVVAIRSQVDSGPLINPNTLLDSSAWGTMRDNNRAHVQTSYPAPPQGMAVWYCADRQGELAFCITNTNGYETLYRLADGAWQKCPVNLDQIWSISPGDNPGELVVTGPGVTGRKPGSLEVIDAATGRVKQVLLQNKEHDIVDGLFGAPGIFRDPATHLIVGVSYQTTGPEMTWFSPDYQALQKILNAHFRRLVVRIVGGDRAGDKFLVVTYSDRQPPIYYRLNIAERPMKLGLVKASRPWIDPARMRPMNIMTFETRDGHHLDAFVTLPAGASAQHPAPLVVLPHGSLNGVRPLVLNFQRNNFALDARTTCYLDLAMKTQRNLGDFRVKPHGLYKLRLKNPPLN